MFLCAASSPVVIQGCKLSRPNAFSMDYTVYTAKDIPTYLKWKVYKSQNKFELSSHHLKIMQNVTVLKFVYSEKATKIWQNLQTDATKNFKL